MSTRTGYDFIGDIHGHADELERLLAKLGYAERDGVYEHSERRVVFLGDFIDRGPKIARVLEIARGMASAGRAKAVMGNHEFNALAFHNEHPDMPGQPIRPHSEKNLHQHQATLDQLSDSQMDDAMDWFAGLPMWLELENVRAVHACWSPNQIEVIEQHLRKHDCGGKLNPKFLADAFDSSEEGTPLYLACEDVLKGTEAKLPEGYLFIDKAKVHRHHIRTRWFSQGAATYQELAFGDSTFHHMSNTEVPVEDPLPLQPDATRGCRPYPGDAPPCFVGHYWLRADRPQRLSEKVACLDYSVAKDGYLCAYRWDGEQEIDNSKFVWTD